MSEKSAHVKTANYKCDAGNKFVNIRCNPTFKYNRHGIGQILTKPKFDDSIYRKDKPLLNVVDTYDGNAIKVTGKNVFTRSFDKFKLQHDRIGNKVMQTSKCKKEEQIDNNCNVKYFDNDFLLPWRPELNEKSMSSELKSEFNHKKKQHVKSQKGNYDKLPCSSERVLPSNQTYLANKHLMISQDHRYDTSKSEFSLKVFINGLMEEFKRGSWESERSDPKGIVTKETVAMHRAIDKEVAVSLTF